MEEVDKFLLHCASKDVAKRVEAYHNLTELLPSLPLNSEWGCKIKKNDAQQMIENIKVDVLSPENNVCYEVTGFLGCVLANEKLMDLLSLDEEQQIMDILIQLLKETKDTNVLSRGLWSLAQSKFECETYSKNLTFLLDVINDIFECDPSNIIIYETLQVLKSLMESVQEKMIETVDKWLPKIFAYLFHDSIKVRGVTYSCFNYCQFYSQENKCVHVVNKQIVPFIPQLKSDYLKQMVKFLEGSCTFALKTWRLLVILLGQDLHSGSTLINGFLEVVEKAFKSSKPEVRVDAFKCWHVLINNFATNLEVLSHPKRLKLLIAPLRSNNAKTQDSSFIKLHTWWFLVCKLEGNVSKNFDLVIIPLLKFCFDLTRASQSSTTNERKLLISGSPTPCTKYPNLVLKSIEVLLNILNCEQTVLSNFTNSTTHSVLNNSLFLKNYNLIFGCIIDAIMSLNLTEDDHRKVSQEIIISTLAYINAILKDHYCKKESVDMLKEFLKIFDFFEGECKPGDSLSLFCYDFIKLCLRAEEGLPNNVLQSRYYYIPVGTKLRDIMSGSLSNYFVHKLCRPVLSHHATDESGYLDLWEVLLEKENMSSKLEFYEAVLEELKNTVPYFSGKNPEAIVSTWSLCTKSLNIYIDKTSQINQGDNSEHDWACIYMALMFPLNCSTNLHSIKEISYKKLITVWVNLWNSFTTIATLTATAEPNCEAEYIASKMLKLVQEKLSSPESSGFTMTLFADILCHVTEKFKFKELGVKTKTSMRSPLLPKKKPHPLSNLQSLLETLIILMRKTLEITSYWRHKTMHNLCRSFNKIFDNISHQQRAWVVVSTVCDVIKQALQVNPRAKFNPETEKSFIAMWNSFCRLIEYRFIPNITQEKLTYLSPMISVALQSSHTCLRQRTRVMWSTFFASTSLKIPETLFNTLKEVGLPPATYDKDSSGDSQSFSPKNIKVGIPQLYQQIERTRFSSVSPKLDFKLKLSPLGLNSRSPMSVKKTKIQEKNLLNIDELKSDDFVVVSSPKVKKRVFTAHQLEKLNERAVIPALYNDLSQSQSQIAKDFSDYGSLSSEKSSKTSSPKQSSSDISFKGKITPGSSKDLNKSYSEEELDEVLKNTSFELEKSFSESIVALEPLEFNDLRRSKRSRNSLTYTKEGFIAKDYSSLASAEIGFETNTNHKRKSHTPVKKSILDIKKKLKGNHKTSSNIEKKVLDKSNSFENSSEVTNKKIVNDNLESVIVSPLASPLKSPKKCDNVCRDESKENLEQEENISTSKTYLFKRKKITKKNSYMDDDTLSDSHEEIPSSQTETPSFSILQPFKGLNTFELNADKSLQSSDRPKRNKRKSIFENEYMYMTPSKRTKVSPTKKSFEDLSDIEDSVICLDEEGNDPEINIDSEDPLRKKDSFDKGETYSNASKGDSEILQNHNLEQNVGSSQKRERISEGKKLTVTHDMILSRNLQSSPKNSESDNNICNGFNISENMLDLTSRNSYSSPPTTPNKITRSGRRVIPPNKDMPEPMTPPGVKNKGLINKDQPKESITPVKESAVANISKLNIVGVNENAEKVQNTSPSKVNSVPVNSSESKPNSFNSTSTRKKYLRHNSEESNLNTSIEFESKGDKGKLNNIDITKLCEVKVVLNEIGNKYSPKKSVIVEHKPIRKECPLNEIENSESTISKEKNLPEKLLLNSEINQSKNSNEKSSKGEEHSHKDKRCISNKPSLSTKTKTDHILNDAKSLFREMILSPEFVKQVSKIKRKHVFSKEFYLPSNGLIFTEASQNLFKNLVSKSCYNLAHRRSQSLENISIFHRPMEISSPVKPFQIIIPESVNEKNINKILICNTSKPSTMMNALSKENLRMSNVMCDGAFTPAQKSKDPVSPDMKVLKKNVCQYDWTTNYLQKSSEKNKDASLKIASPSKSDESSSTPISAKVNVSSKSNDKESPIILTPKFQGKKIFIITSPRSCSPIKKVVYSSQPDKKSNNSQILVIRKLDDRDKKEITANANKIALKSIPEKQLERKELGKSDNSLKESSNLRTSKVSEETLESENKDSGKLNDNQKGSAVSSNNIPTELLRENHLERRDLNPSDDTLKKSVENTIKILTDSTEKMMPVTEDEIEKLKPQSPIIDLFKIDEEMEFKDNISEDKNSKLEKESISIEEKESQEKQSHNLDEIMMRSSVSKALRGTDKRFNKETGPAKKLKASKKYSRSLKRKIKTTQRKLNNEITVSYQSTDQKGSKEALNGNIEYLETYNNKNNNNNNTTTTNNNNNNNEINNLGEKDSPNKENSKLSNSVGTPERKKLSMKRVQVPGSRAAIMLACARRTRRTKDENKEREESPKAFSFGEKPSTLDSLRFSPRSSITPKRRTPFNDALLEDRPWAKHEPSPTASPCGSILKKRQVEDDSISLPVGEISDQVEESPSVSKSRRVSFADPPVSEKVVIPSTQGFKVYKAQKRLDMTRAINPTSHLESENSQNSQDKEEISLDMPNCSQSIYSSLVGCEDPIDTILPKLTSKSLIESLKGVFEDRDIETIGDLCSVTEKELTSFPIRSPKKSNTIKCLKQYEESLNKEKHVLEIVENIDNLTKEEPENMNRKSLLINDEPEGKGSESDNLTLLEYGPDIANSQEEEDFIKPPSEKELSSTHCENDELASKDLKKLWEQIEKEDGLDSFVEGLSSEGRLKLFENLTNAIPYKNVIDSFHKYLTRQNVP